MNSTESGFRRERTPTRLTEVVTLEARIEETVLRIEVIEAAERIVSGGSKPEVELCEFFWEVRFRETSGSKLPAIRVYVTIFGGL